MEFHPSKIPISKTFEIQSESEASDAAQEMVKIGFLTQKGAFRVLMTKEKELAKKIGFLIINEINFGLRKTGQERDVRYWIYHHDTSHYAMVLISSQLLQDLGF